MNDEHTGYAIMIVIMIIIVLNSFHVAKNYISAFWMNAIFHVQ